MIEWECIECGNTYIDQIDGCVGERMCYDCLDQDEELFTYYDLNVPNGKYQAKSMVGLIYEVFKHRLHHLFKHGKWID